MGVLLISCRDAGYAESHYLPPLARAGWVGEVRFQVPGAPLPPPEGMAGIVLTGGLDIHPRNWDPQEPVHPAAQVDEERDAMEIPLVRLAWDRRIPLLGICRGEQILNVALGGSMIQDVPEHFGCAPDLHQHGSAQEPGALHDVRFETGSILATLLGTASVQVNSRHHQAVHRIAPGLRACAFDPGTRVGDACLVEAIEAVDPGRWTIGVQWHPEDLAIRQDPVGLAARNLFAAFVARIAPEGPGDRSAIISG